MAGTIQVSEGRGWSVSTGLFCWVVETLATEAPADVAASLRESTAEHPGRLDLADFPPEQRDAIGSVLRALPAIARERLPHSASRAAVIATLEDLCAAA
jgi:hypothetical protein